MLALFSAVLSIVVLIAFFYLVHLVSHIRNAVRVQVYTRIVERMETGMFYDSVEFENMRRLGVLTDEQAEALVKRNNYGKDEESDDKES